MFLQGAKKGPRPMVEGEKIDMGIKAVRVTGKVNMYMERNSVMYYAFHMGFYETVSFLSTCNIKEYIERLKNIKHDFFPDIDKDFCEELLDTKCEFEARKMLEEYGYLEMNR